MMLTCNTCGHRGEYGKGYAHDCYWVFRSRAQTIATTIECMTKKRGYSRDFTPKTDRRIKIEIDRVPPTLASALKAKARREGISIRALTLTLWKQWTEQS